MLESGEMKNYKPFKKKKKIPSKALYSQPPPCLTGTGACSGGRGLLAGSARRASARRSLMTGQRVACCTENQLTRRYIRVPVPVESGWLLLRQIRDWGKL